MVTDYVAYETWTNWVTRHDVELVPDFDKKGQPIMKPVHKPGARELEVVTLRGGRYDGTKVEVNKKALGIYFSPDGNDKLSLFEHYRRHEDGTFVAVTTD